MITLNTTPAAQDSFIFDYTPIERIEDVLVKRDELFNPFQSLICGGKIRQAYHFLFSQREKIIKHHNSTIIFSTQVNGTTGPIFAELAKHFGLKCIVCVGATTEEKLPQLPMMHLARQHGAEIRILAQIGYAQVLNSRIRDIIKQHKYFDVGYSFENASLYRESFIEVNAHQVQNLPDNLDALVFPVGTGLQFASMLHGLAKYNKKVKRVIGVRVGPDRTDSIKSFFNSQSSFDNLLSTQTGVFEFEVVPYSSKMNYAKPFEIKVGDISLDPYYESKCWSWLQQNRNMLGDSVCFWNVGRHPTAKQIYEVFPIDLNK